MGWQVCTTIYIRSCLYDVAYDALVKELEEEEKEEEEEEEEEKKRRRRKRTRKRWVSQEMGT